MSNADESACFARPGQSFEETRYVLELENLRSRTNWYRGVQKCPGGLQKLYQVMYKEFWFSAAFLQMESLIKISPLSRMVIQLFKVRDGVMYMGVLEN